jgi:ethanolamine utilization protein EutQ
MLRAKLISPESRRLEQVVPGEPGIHSSKDVGPDISKTFGAGVITFENCALKWKNRVDEYFYCLEGELTIVTAEGDLVLKPGYGVWIPKGYEITYRAGKLTRAVYTIFPANPEAS